LIGDEPNSMYFMIHFILLFFGPLIILNTKRTFWKDACSGICFILLYFGYVLIMVHTFSVTNNATGLVPGDWNEWGEYGAVDNLLHLSFPYIVPVAFGLVTLFILLVMYLYGLLQKNKQYIYNYSNKNLFIL
jgi:Ca2+/Na+ antiporter